MKGDPKLYPDEREIENGVSKGCYGAGQHSILANARSLTLTPSVGTDEQNTACLERHRPVRKRKVKNRQCTFLDQEI